MADKGQLQVITLLNNSYIPIPNAKVLITADNPVEAPDFEAKTLITNSEGKTPLIDVPTPPIERSLNADNTLIPYTLINIAVQADGYEEFIIKGVQILPYQIAVQICPLREAPATREKQQGIQIQEIIIIPPNRQFGDFPPKIPEDPEKPLPPPPSGLVVLPEPVVPEYIIVHAGTPSDPSAPNYKVPYNEYLKNVASSEIYATWPDATIRANVYAINSFALNRIYTEWYRGKGFDFDITNSTAFDQAFSFGRNIFENIGLIVDEIFSTYIKRPGAKQPLLTQYCDGRYVSCPDWMTQWGSKDLGERGYTPFEILTNYYGNDLQLERAPKVSGSPKSYPGYVLTIGSKGEPVKTVQTYLNRIAQNYPLIGKVPVDGIYGESTANQVKLFQQTFDLPQTGQVDYATWYRISAIYVGVTKIAELRGGSESREIEKEELVYINPPSPYEDEERPRISYKK